MNWLFSDGLLFLIRLQVIFAHFLFCFDVKSEVMNFEMASRDEPRGLFPALSLGVNECKMRVCVINVSVLHLDTHLCVPQCLPLVLKDCLCEPSPSVVMLFLSLVVVAAIGLRLCSAGSLSGFKSSPSDSWRGFVTDRSRLFLSPLVLLY